MNKLQEFHANIEEYLKVTLSDEKLSPAAQIKRHHLLDQFYALGLQPDVQHRPSDSPTVVKTAHSTEQEVRTRRVTSGCLRNETFQTKENEKIERNELISSKPTSVVKSDEAQVVQNEAQNGAIDRDSDVAYESFDDEDDDKVNNVNQVCEGSGRVGERILLPLAKTKKGDASFSTWVSCITKAS